MIPTNIKDCYITECTRYFDHRGFFQEIYSHKNHLWRQISWSKSKKYVMRGIHEAPFQKLVTCVQGEIYDVVVDLRKDSPTFLNWNATILNQQSTKQVFIPSGCGHGFFCLQTAMVVYLQDDIYEKSKENDWHYTSFNIDWPKSHKYILSSKDKKAPIFVNS